MMYQAPLDDGNDIVSYVQAIKDRFWVVVAATLVLGLFGWYVGSTRTETFEASSRVFVAPTPVGSSNPNVLNSVVLETESEVIRSLSIAERIEERTGLNATTLLSDVSVRFIPDSSVLRVSYTTTEPELAADVVNGFAELYVEDRISAADSFYATIANDQQSALDEISADVDALTAELSRLDAEKAALNRDATLTAEIRQSEIARVDADRSTAATARNLAINQQRALSTGLRETEAARNTLAPPAEVLQLAGVPQSPSSLSPNIFLVGLTLAGVLLGLVLALVLERFDLRASEKQEVERTLGAGVLASIPKFGLSFRSGNPRPVMLMNDSRSRLIVRAREAFRRLRTALQFISTQDEVRSIVVTSSRPGEGKSQVAASLAISIARGGRRVALVSADMRRPTIEKLFNLPFVNDGLSTILAGETGAESLVELEEPNLYLLPAGPAPSNPGELLASERLTQLIEVLEESVDFVIFDSPPVLSTADALGVAPRVDGVLIVIDSTATETAAVAEVKSQIDRVGGRIIGAVLNRDRQASRRFTFRTDPYAYESK